MSPVCVSQHSLRNRIRPFHGRRLERFRSGFDRAFDHFDIDFAREARLHRVDHRLGDGVAGGAFVDVHHVVKAVAARFEVVGCRCGGVGIQVAAKFFADLVDGVGRLDAVGEVDFQAHHAFAHGVVGHEVLEKRVRCAAVGATFTFTALGYGPRFA